MTGKAATGFTQVRHAGQDYALAVSSDVDPRSVDSSSDEVDSDSPGELSWVDVMPERDRRLFAEEMSRLMAEAAETDDFTLVQQVLREWRATADIHADPVLARRLSGPLVANGARVPKPVV